MDDAELRVAVLRFCEELEGAPAQKKTTALVPGDRYWLDTDQVVVEKMELRRDSSGVVTGVELLLCEGGETFSVSDSIHPVGMVTDFREAARRLRALLAR